MLQTNFQISIISVHRLELSHCTIIKFYETKKMKFRPALFSSNFYKLELNQNSMNSSIRTNFDKLRALQLGKSQIYTIELQQKSDFEPNRI